MAVLDHLILRVKDLDASVRFYRELLGFADEGMDGPFAQLRAGPDCLLLLAPWDGGGAEHLAFAVSGEQFAAIFARLKAAGVAHGPRFDAVGSNTGPGRESGARGEAPTLYFHDPDRHLLEIRTYERPT